MHRWPKEPTDEHVLRQTNWQKDRQTDRQKEIYICAAVALFLLCSVQLRLASPGLLHVKKIEEWIMSNKLHLENNPEVM
jgi:hypothetical protein